MTTKPFLENLQPDGTGADSAPPFMLLWFATLERITSREQLVRNLLLCGSLFVVYGQSNSGKTFWMLDLALAIAAGISWRGLPTHRGLVVYVAGEGAASVRARVSAYRAAHPEVASGLPFAIVPQAVDFLSLESVACLIETIRATVSEQRDLEGGQRMPFELVPVRIGADPDDGHDISSCVVKHLDTDERPTAASFELRGKAQRQFLASLRARTESDPTRIWGLA